MSNLCIKSDFTDFYDIYSVKDGQITYNRYRSESRQRWEALKYLRSLGLKTIELKPVQSYTLFDPPIVVYTNPKLHSGNGKKVLSINEALQIYPSCVASLYYKDSINTIKVIQVGKRQFRITFRREISNNTLTPGNIIDIKEIKSDYNRVIGLPIYSIDFISINNEMIATDFNEVEVLYKYEINRYINGEEIINEVLNSLIIYNKAI